MPLKRSKRDITIFSPEDTLSKMVQSGDEVSYKEFIDTGSYTAGLVRFKPKEVHDGRYILHERDDVLCYIISGHGVLRIGDDSKEVQPGSIIYIPYGNNHDFVAKDQLLVFFVKITGEI